ncbi:MAG: DUF2905 family protein [Candidatus Caldatribacteriota bacterium]|jgi:hypothetical protein
MWDINSISKTLIIIGIIIALLGIILFILGKIPSFNFRLPGDILIKGKNYVFYFPLGWCILISILLTILLRIFRK